MIATLLAFVTTSCASVGSGTVAGSAVPVTGSRSVVAAPASPGGSCAERVAGSLDARAQAAQLLVVGSPLGDPVTASTALLARTGAGGVLLTGRSRAGVAAVADRTGQLQHATPDARIGLLVSADQEGGEVQTLTGPGFSTIPSATVQGGWAPADLTTAATRWGAELKRAGVNLDLAPVSDVLRSSLGRNNLSVGVSDRTFGTTPDVVERHVLAFLSGLRAAGVATAVKHFPGLGEVAANTDLTAGVRDTVTGADSPWLRPFRAAVEWGTPVVMVSSAIYDRIDPSTPAAFSPVVIGELLRRRLGFTGVVVSDDLGVAVAVAGIPAAQRATRFIAAGGDLILTASAEAAGPMLDGLLSQMRSDSHFAAQVRAALGRVLALKATLGLLHC